MTQRDAWQGHPEGVALDYLARYTLGSGCPYDGYLQSTDGTYNHTNFITDTGPTSAAKIPNNLPVGNYHIAMTTGGGCYWSVTFNPPLELAISEKGLGEWFRLFL